MKKSWIILFVLIAASPAVAEINVITSSPDLASIAKSVGGDKIKVESLAKHDDDLHYLAARPDYILKANRADVFIYVGLDLEVGWLPLVLRRSANGQVQRGGKGHCDASANINVLEKPKGEINRQMGDVHPLGNPHYLADPVNGIRVAQTIAKCFSSVDSKNKEIYFSKAEQFKKRMIGLTAGWLKELQPLFGSKVVVYHKEFEYFAKRFRLDIAGSVESLPGVPPGPSDMNAIVNKIKKERIKVILASPWSNLGYAREAADRSGAKLVILPIQANSEEGNLASAYERMINTLVSIVKTNFHVTKPPQVPSP